MNRSDLLRLRITINKCFFMRLFAYLLEVVSYSTKQERGGVDETVIASSNIQSVESGESNVVGPRRN